MQKGLEPSGRLASLDFFRGFTMFLLIAEGTHLFSSLVSPELEGTLLHAIGTQLHHHPWHGLHFWDLVQPFFMFIVGVAMPFSIARRKERGETNKQLLNHVIRRSLTLLILGWALYCISPGYITFRFQNVLAQLSVTYLVAYLLMKRSAATQITITLLILVAVDILYRVFPVAGFNQPFVPDHNFGAWFDMLISGELSGGHWVSFNAVPTIAHTVWGVLVGKLLMSDQSVKRKVLTLVFAGLIGVIAGYSLDLVTPIIKRIATGSFVIVTGGWCLLAMAFSYWFVDVLGFKNWTLFFAIVGMNPLFIYLFAHIGGDQLVYSVVKPFSMGLLSWISPLFAEIITAMITWYLLWYICYWLYKRRIFFKI